MKTLMQWVRGFVREEEGTEVVEWAILASILLITAGTIWVTLGDAVVAEINALITCLTTGTCA